MWLSKQTFPLTIACLRPRCWTLVTFDVLLQICRLFWSLSKPAQDSLLWAMQTSGACLGSDSSSEKSDESLDDISGGETKKRRPVQWFFNGIQVCRHAFQRMLGVGCERLTRTRSSFQGLDERFLKGQGRGTRPALASASVSSFLQHLYYSVSESMPTESLRLCLSVFSDLLSWQLFLVVTVIFSRFDFQSEAFVQ